MRRFVLGAVIVFLAGPAFGSIIDNDTYTTDTETGLYWLDWSETAGMTFASVAREIDGGRLSGWSYASQDDLDIFIDHNVRWFPGYGIPDETWYNEYSALVSLLGPTVEYSYGDYRVHRGTAAFLHPEGMQTMLDNYGVTHDVYPAYDAHVGMIKTMGDTLNWYIRAHELDVSLPVGSVMDDISLSTHGHVLVRDTQPPVPPAAVPEPSTFIIWSLLGLTFGGIAWRRRKR